MVWNKEAPVLKEWDCMQLCSLLMANDAQCASFEPIQNIFVYKLGSSNVTCNVDIVIRLAGSVWIVWLTYWMFKQKIVNLLLVDLRKIFLAGWNQYKYMKLGFFAN